MSRWNIALTVFTTLFLMQLCSGSLCANPARDSLPLQEYYSHETVNKKLDWFLHSNMASVSEFIIKHPKHYDTLIRSVQQGNDEYHKFQLHYLEGQICYHQNKFQKAVPIFLSLLNETRFITQEDSVRVLVNLKNCFARLLNYSKVFEIHQLLIDMSKRNPNINKGNLGLPLSSIFINMGLIKDGVKVLKEEYKKNHSNQNEKYAEVNLYNNLGVVWNKGHNPDSAIYYFNLALPLAERFVKADPENLFPLFLKGLILGNIGQALMAKNRFKDAIPLLKQDIDHSLRYGNLLNAAISYNELAQCYYKIKQLKLAEVYLDSSSYYLQEVDDPQEYLKNIKLRADIYAGSGRHKMAVEAYQIYNNLKDSITMNEKELFILNQQIAFKTNELEAKIETQEQERLANLIDEEKNNFQRKLMLVIILLMLGLLIFGYLSYRKSKKATKVLFEKNNEITHKSKLISDTLKEKELLIKEVHHRVKNNMQIIMSLLKLQAEKINDKRVEAYFAEARNRIRSMALIHEFLYKKDKMDFMQMDEYIKQLIAEIQLSYAQPNHIIEIHTDLDPILLDFDTSIPLGLIINELVTNSYKHAFPNGVGTIWVTFKNKDQHYVLFVRDNGIGTPSDLDLKIENSLGMELIHLLTSQINATIKLHHQQGFGVEISFTAPGIGAH